MAKLLKYRFRHRYISLSFFKDDLFSTNFSLLPGYHAYHDGNYYVFSTSGLNWHDARDACADQGGHLVEIGSGAEQEFLDSIIAQSKCPESP